MGKQKEEEGKKNSVAILLEERKKAIYNLVLLLAAAFVVLIGVMTMAWFANNETVTGDSISVTLKSPEYTIKPLGNPAVVGIYDDSVNSAYVRNKLLDEGDFDSRVITWTITKDTVTNNGDGSKTYNHGQNIGNGPAEGYEGGINPGSQGTIQFIVQPNVSSIKLAHNFRFHAYTGGYDEHGDEDPDTITYIGTTATNDWKLAEKLFNGHILLFSEKDENGEYSGLITSNDQFNRLLKKSYTTQNTVSIHWVWTETLAELIFDDGNTDQAKKLKGKKSICNSTGRAEVISFLKSHPDWFLYDPENANHAWTEISNASDNNDVVQKIYSGYQMYSSYYNEADQYIGTMISYVLLYMNTIIDTTN